MAEKEKITQTLMKRFKDDKKVKILSIILMLGIVLIAVSEFIPKKEKSNSDPESVQTISTDQYTQALEKKISSMIGSIHGVGSLKVMVTLEQGQETIFAQEVKQSTDQTGEVNASGKTQSKESLEKKYILVEGDNGKKQALVITTKEPVIKGIVVVCEGGDQTSVQSNIINALTTALDISSTRVCVAKIDAKAAHSK